MSPAHAFTPGGLLVVFFFLFFSFLFFSFLFFSFLFGKREAGGEVEEDGGDIPVMILFSTMYKPFSTYCRGKMY